MTTPTTMTRVAVHMPGCPDTGKAGVIHARRIPARDADAYALPHTCLPGGWAGPEVIQTMERIATHPYRPGKVHPVGMKRPLCADCRNPYADHPEG